MADGGGIILDMLCHWRYVIDNLFGNVVSLCCFAANHVRRRWDEQGRPYDADAKDAAYTTLLTDREVVCQFNSSWCTRVNRDELLIMHVDGTDGSAAVGLRDVKVQAKADTPRAIWNPDVESPIDFRAAWRPSGGDQQFDNAFKAQWELFLRHVARGEPFRWGLKEAAKGVQFAELATRSWQQRRWVDVPEL